MKKIITLSIISILGILIAWQIYQKAFSSSGGKERRRTGPVPVAVEIKPVEKGLIRDIRDFTGTMNAHSQFVIAPKVAGRLKKIFFNIGDRVRAGQTVALLDDEEYRQQVDQARAELDVAKANLEESDSSLEITKREYDRTVALRAKKIASESELDAAESKYRAQEAKLKVARAQVLQKEAALKVAEVRLSYTQILVPPSEGDGYRVVGERYVHEGALLAPNNPIIAIFDIRSMIAAIHVIERDYSHIRVGMAATITTDAYPGKIFTGKVVRKAPLLQEASREARVEIEVPNGEGYLKPGMFLRAEIEFSRKDNATLVPREALTKREDRNGVFVVDREEKKARFVPVETGIIHGGKAEIAAPSIGGYVVTLGQDLLETNAPVILPGDKGEGSRNEKGKKKRSKKSKGGDGDAEENS